jgi:DNA-binding transcriptional LysR family regulator
MPPYRVVMELGTTHSIVTAVAAGAGLGWVSTQAIQGRDLTRIATIRIEDLPLNRSIYMVHDTRRMLPRVARAFVDWVIATRQPAVGGASWHAYA